MVEESFSQSMIRNDNQFLRLFESPILVGFFVMTAGSLLWPFLGPAVTSAVARAPSRGEVS